MARWLDRFLMLLFALAGFTSLVYTPLFLLGCGWDGLALGADGPCAASWAGRGWLAYTQVEPLYSNIPIWLQMVNEFDTYFFGWFYLLSLIVFLRGRQRHPGYRALATFMSGMMAYAMTFYMVWEIRTYRDTGADLGAVITFNGMWVLLFVSLMARLYLVREPESAAA
ncbi:hypothetical protein [Hydrocarboniphaga sp.]|uniref:hypothetical protein n=1 Tax=Hydrocarboniphaga sp. TaxID=2033016 RepID=UPI003D0AC0A3